MKVFLVALVAAGVLAYGASLILNQTWQATSYAAYTTSGARVDDPGDNLVGADWPEAAAAAAADES
ncbi:hypothetical protein [Pararhizobium haloflavum]|uniref:hypothetical protein n=1 Tax=Pararhizobium haloflavum TaxID=2037914 RepID=UPI000C186B41|nr:hypothetical protein [Pararhizobium haloflavum]